MKDQFSIAYGFSNCSDRVYRKLFAEKKQFVMVTDQKYHGLLQRGFVKNGAAVRCYSGLPVNRNVTSKLIVREKDDEENGIRYHYYTTLNHPLIRKIMIFLAGFFNILFSREHYDCVICDFMSTMNTFGMSLAGKIRKIPVLQIVMDLPGLMNTTGEPVQGIYRRIAGLADGFVLLTEQMSEVVNLHRKPFIVMEGHVDVQLPEAPEEEKWEITEGKKVIIYAGGIHRIFGIETLVKGFLRAAIEGAELRIFGDGDYRSELEETCRNHPSICYMGVADNREIVRQEQRAALLVNPRPAVPIYTRFSFPSKNMEYMVSGTPVLTTNLPGMPEEYREYVYILDEESEEGLAAKLNDIFRTGFAEREEKGRRAREYVLNYKNNNIQSGRIIDFVKKQLLDPRRKNASSER